jgi:hypothetical protein
MMIVSLGTGTEMKSYPINKYKNVGKLAWIGPIIDILLSANAETVDYQLNQMFMTLAKETDRIITELILHLKRLLPRWIM